MKTCQTITNDQESQMKACLQTIFLQLLVHVKTTSNIQISISFLIKKKSNCGII